jgi:hypothetical protein
MFTDHETVRDAVTSEAQSSVTVNILVCRRPNTLTRTIGLSTCVTIAPQPPVAVANPRAVSICEEVGLSPNVVVLPNVVNANGGGAATVKPALQVEVVGAQLLVKVNVTTFVPPHLLGPEEPPLLLNAPLHPPLAVAVVSHAVNIASTWACVRQDPIDTLVGQCNDTAGATATVKTEVAVVVVGAQLLVKVNVTTFVPPHLSGPEVPPLLLNAPLHPPLAVAALNQAVNDASICACVWQLARVVFTGAVRVTACENKAKDEKQKTAINNDEK